MLPVRSDTKDSRESSSKLKGKHKLPDASSEGERAHKESRHESYSRDHSQTDAEKASHRDEKRNDVRTPADKVHNVDVRPKDRSHRSDADADSRSDSDRGHRTAEHDQLSADETSSGNRSGDGHRRSVETAAGKPADERGKGGHILAQ